MYSASPDEQFTMAYILPHLRFVFVFTVPPSWRTLHNYLGVKHCTRVTNQEDQYTVSYTLSHEQSIIMSLARSTVCCRTFSLHPMLWHQEKCKHGHLLTKNLTKEPIVHKGMMHVTPDDIHDKASDVSKEVSFTENPQLYSQSLGCGPA